MPCEISNKADSDENKSLVTLKTEQDFLKGITQKILNKIENYIFKPDHVTKL